MLRARVFRSGQPPVPADEMERAALRADPTNLLWVDAQAPSSEELDRLVHLFHLAPAVGEVVRQGERTSAVCVAGEQYGLTVHPVEPERDEAAPHGRLLRLDLVVDGNVLLSVHDRALPFVPALEQPLGTNTHLEPFDADSLLHVFLDSLLDHFAHLADELERRVELLEDRLLRDTGRQALGDILLLKRHVQHLRRLVAALDEPLTTLLAPDSPLSGRQGVALAPFQTLNQRHDQLLQRIDRIRDLASGSHDLYLSSVSFRTNEQL